MPGGKYGYTFAVPFARASSNGGRVLALTTDKRKSSRPTRTIKTAARGADVLRNPMLNKGTAFSAPSGNRSGLEGSLPFRSKNQQQQAERIYRADCRRSPTTCRNTCC